MEYRLCRKYKDCKGCPRSVQCDAELLGLSSKPEEGKNKYTPRERKKIYIPIKFWKNSREDE